MKMKWTDLLCIVAIAAVTVLAAFVYDGVPDELPTHNARGVVDGYMSKTTLVALLVAVPIVPFLLVKALPAISPRGFRMDSFQRVTDIVALAITVMAAGTSAAGLLAASGRNVPILVIAQVLSGSVFVVLGNYLGKVRRNFFIGIRTPWTLASEEVWARTNRFGGRVFMIAGAALVALAWTPAATRARFPFTLLGVLGVAAVVVIVHSYVVYRRLHGKHALGGAD